MTVSFITGDCRGVLPLFPSDSFDCVVTSPPYFGLRDYGHAAQIGMETSFNDYLDSMVGICAEIKRILKPNGTFWLNIGDSYAGSGKGGGGSFEKERRAWREGIVLGTGVALQGRNRNGIGPVPGIPAKNLLMIPNRLAIRLQEDGWLVRSEIIWHKPNPMPESVRDRPTCSHEKVWLLTKSARYYYDSDAVREPLAESALKTIVGGYKPKFGGNKGQGSFGSASRRASGNEFIAHDGALLRNVWRLAPQPYKGAHFAVMPPNLVERCIRLGCPEGGIVLDPFGGAGTVGLAAQRLGRNATIIELNPEYIELSQNRLNGENDKDAPK